MRSCLEDDNKENGSGQRPRHGQGHPGGYGTQQLAHGRRRIPPFGVGLLLFQQVLARGELLLVVRAAGTCTY